MASATVHCNTGTLLVWQIAGKRSGESLPDAGQLHRRDRTANPDTIKKPTAYIADGPNQVIGKVAASYLASGQSIRTHQLRAPHVISRGQKVRLVVTGTGFTVSTEGDALAAAAEGEVVQVRNHTGRIISGIAREGGIVEVRQ